MSDKYRENLSQGDKEIYDLANFSYQENNERLANIKLSFSDCNPILAQQNENRFIKNKNKFLLDYDKNNIPNEIHYIWLGSPLPFLYRWQILQGILYNNTYHFNLWYCKELLSHEQAVFMEKFAYINGITLHNILHYQFANMDLILNTINNQHFATAADLIRIEDYFAGIYLDTDIDHHAPLPLFTNRHALKMDMGIQTSYENMQLGPSNSVIVSSYDNCIIKKYREVVRNNLLNKQYSIDLKDAYLTCNGQFHSPESARFEREVLCSTGPYVLSKVIEEFTGMGVLPKPNEDEQTYFLRTYPLFEISMAGYIEVRPNDLTWVPEYRKIFNYINYKQEQNKKNAYIQLQNKVMR